MVFLFKYYSEVIFQKTVLQLVFIISYIHGFIASTFGDISLNDHHNSISQSFIDDTSRQSKHYKTPLPYFGSVSNYNKVEKKEDGEEICMVCLQEIVDGDEVRNLINCRHIFHKCCLDPWVELGRRVCPLCRSSLVEEADDGSGDDGGGYGDDGGGYGDDVDYYESFQHLTLTSNFSFIDASIEYCAYILQ